MDYVVMDGNERSLAEVRFNHALTREENEAWTKFLADVYGVHISFEEQK